MLDLEAVSQVVRQQLAAKRRLSDNTQRKLVFVSGNFNVVHPGHLRLLQFAAGCGDFLVVGVTTDDALGVSVPLQARLAGVSAIGLVDHALPLTGPVEQLLEALRPDVVVKGKEYESRANPEQAVVNAYGGSLLFSGGDVRFSSLDLLRQELVLNSSTLHKPIEFAERHRFIPAQLAHTIRQFGKLRVAVIGDLIVDEYITCEPLGMSREDPTIVVTPLAQQRFVGGAGIVAAHARGLGAEVSFFGVAGLDEAANYAREALAAYGVKAHLLTDPTRPTTLKQRFRAAGKSLLRVSHLKQHDIQRLLADQLLSVMKPVLANCDLMIFADFNYGTLPQYLVEELSAAALEHGVMMVADSQASSQLGDVSRFSGMHLITPTEHEARLATKDANSGLVTLAEKLRQQARASHVFLTLGAEGLFILAPDVVDAHALTADQLPAFNQQAKDPSGAGDSLLTASALALAVGASVWEAAYLGSLAAACQVGRVGNTPLTTDELSAELLT